MQKALAAPHARPLNYLNKIPFTFSQQKKKKVVTGSPWVAKKCIYTLVKKLLYVKLTYCDHPNKNIEHLDLRITKSWVQQK